MIFAKPISKADINKKQQKSTIQFTKTALKPNVFKSING